MDPINGDQVYAAERLLDRRMRAGKQEYLVKWKGWSKNYNSWEPVENILDERLISEFNKMKEKKTPPKRKRGAASAKSTPSQSDATPSGKEDAISPASEPPPAKRGRRSTRAAAASTVANDEPNTPSTSRRSGRVTRPPAKLGADDSGAAAAASDSDAVFDADEDDDEDADADTASEHSAASSANGARKSAVVSATSRGRKKAADTPAASSSKKSAPKASKAVAKVQRAPLGTPPSVKVRRGDFTAAVDEDDDDEEEERPAASDSAPKPEEIAEDDKAATVAERSKPNAETAATVAPKPNPIQLESSAAESSAGEDEPVNTTAKPVPTEALSAGVPAPDEIYVSKANGSSTSEKAPATDDGNVATSTVETLVITNKDDPNCTHKIQVHKLGAGTTENPAPTQAHISSDNGAAVSAEQHVNGAGKDRCEIKANTERFFETTQWSDGNGTNGSAEPYQYNGTGTVTEVTAGGSTVKILEI